MSGLFYKLESFNADISNWHTSGVTDMSFMFGGSLTDDGATAFNQPLDFDTSSVTTMESMFYVRFTRVPRPIKRWGPPLHAVLASLQPIALSAPGSHLARNVCSPLWTRQKATAFNQPLSFNTSSVTSMEEMFYVRSTLVLRSYSSRTFSRARCMRSRNPPRHPWLLARTPFRTVCSPLSTRQKAKAFNKPLSFDTSSVTTMEEMFKVHSPRILRSDSIVEPSRARCMRGRNPDRSPRLLVRTPFRTVRVLPLRLGRKRRRSTSR